MCAAQGDDFYIIPVPVGTSASLQPDDVVELRERALGPGEIRTLERVSRRGVEGSDFSTPTGKLLVVTSLQVVPVELGNGVVRLDLLQDTVVRQTWVVPRSGMTHLRFSPGVLIDPGFRVRIRNSSSESDTTARVDLFGYLVEVE